MAQLQRLAVTPAQLQNQRLILTTEQQHYLGRVLRLRGGDCFIAMDGRGQGWRAQLVETAAQDLEAQILEAIDSHSELPVAVTLMAALPKGSGFDDVVRQVTELGVHSIRPIVSERTLLQPSDQKVERWRRIAAEAAEQSERQTVPEILAPISGKVAFQNSDQNYRYICVARGNSRHLLTCLMAGQIEKIQAGNTKELSLNHRASVAIATGPEGGWTENEVEFARGAGFEPVSLGRRILRAVTAPSVALSLISAAFEQD